jgi:hypothetical protein
MFSESMQRDALFMSIKAMGLSECLDTYTDAVSFLLTECLPPVPQFVRIHLNNFPKKSQSQESRSLG